MKRTYRIALAVAFVLAFLAPSVRADTTVKITLAMSGPMTMSADMIAYYKGLKSRTDIKVMDQDQSILIDAGAKQALMLNHLTRQVTPFDPKAAMANLPMTIGEPTVSVKATGETKTVLGRSCAGYLVQMSVPMTFNGETVTMTMSGPAWLTKEGAGMEEIVAFQKAAVEAGLIASPIGTGGTVPAKAALEMAKAFAEAGFVMTQEMQMSVEGSGQMAQMMTQMAITMTITVTDVATTPIPDEKFVVPADYKK